MHACAAGLLVQVIYLKLALANFNARSRLPAVIMGDMNTLPDHPAYM